MGNLLSRTFGLAILVVAVAVAVVVIAGIQTVARFSPAGNSGVTNLRVVPTLRSVTVSAAGVQFSSCHQGTPPRRSTHRALGFPYGHCYVGKPGKIYPITITNGLAARVLVGSSKAFPSDGGRRWVPCMIGRSAVVACVGPGDRPGKDQFLVRNFSAHTKMNKLDPGLIREMRCDHQFEPSGDCNASTGEVEREGVFIVGPYQPDDNSTTWTVTITWMAAPLP